MHDGLELVGFNIEPNQLSGWGIGHNKIAAIGGGGNPPGFKLRAFRNAKFGENVVTFVEFTLKLVKVYKKEKQKNRLRDIEQKLRPLARNGAMQQ